MPIVARLGSTLLAGDRSHAGWRRGARAVAGVRLGGVTTALVEALLQFGQLAHLLEIAGSLECPGSEHRANPLQDLGRLGA